MDRYSFSGKGNILIQATIAGDYGNRSFVDKEPIAYFTDVLVDIAFNNVEKIVRTGTSNLTADSKSEPSFLRVQNIKVNESLQSLLYKKTLNTTNKRVEVNIISSLDGAMFLPISLQNYSINEIFIYNSYKELMSGYILQEGGVITGLPNGQYTVFYNIESEVIAAYSLESPSMPYTSAQVVVDGNLNGETGKFVIQIEQLKLLSRPTLDFNSETPFVDSLEFAIMSNKKIIVNYYE